MKTDFLNAFDRHKMDADTLFINQRLGNAGQLYGLAAECGLKVLMIEFGMQMNNEAPVDNNDKVHADKVWSRYQIYQSGYVNGSNYALSDNNPFSSWSIHQRYWSDNDIDQLDIEMFKNGATQVENMIKRAKIDGLL